MLKPEEHCSFIAKWTIVHLFVCGDAMTVDHAFTCPCGGYPMARHDEIKNVLADAMRDTVSEVEVEPQLLHFNDEHLPGKTANRATEAWVDIRAMGFGMRQQNTF